MRTIASVSLVFIGLSHFSSSSSFGRSSFLGFRSSVFGVHRGGGLFGGKDDSSPTDRAETTTTYPAMTQVEVEDWLEHIPVYAVTDSKGAGVVLKPENDTSVFYFFLNALQANSTLTQLQSSNEELDLKVSAFSLGKIWFNLLNANESKEILLKQPGDEDSETQSVKEIEYRLVPDTRDLLGARMLLTMSPEDGEKMKEAGSMTPEMAQAAIQKAMTESPKFKGTFNQIPVFTIAQMRMQKKLGEGDKESEAVTLLPMYFSLQAMVGTWQQFMKQAPSDVQGTEPAINLMSLHELIEMMMKESEIDWRNVVLIPSSPDVIGDASTAGASNSNPESAMAAMGGATLGDI